MDPDPFILAVVLVGCLGFFAWAFYAAGRRDERAWWVERCAKEITDES